MAPNAWTNIGGDNKWSTNLNWSLGVKPVAGDDVSFSGVSSSAPCTIDENTPILTSCSISSNYLGVVTNSFELKTKGLSISGTLINNNLISIFSGGSGLNGSITSGYLGGIGQVLLDQNAAIASLPALVEQSQLTVRTPSGGLVEGDYSGFTMVQIQNDTASSKFFYFSAGSYILNKLKLYNPMAPTYGFDVALSNNNPSFVVNDSFEIIGVAGQPPTITFYADVNDMQVKGNIDLTGCSSFSQEDIGDFILNGVGTQTVLLNGDDIAIARLRIGTTGTVNFNDNAVISDMLYQDSGIIKFDPMKNFSIAQITGVGGYLQSKTSGVRAVLAISLPSVCADMTFKDIETTLPNIINAKNLCTNFGNNKGIVFNDLFE